MKTPLIYGALAALFLAATGAWSQEKPALDPTLAKLGELVGGKWVARVKTAEGERVMETRFTRAFNDRAIRLEGMMGKGTPGERRTEAFFGWDPVNKNVYYIDLQGPEEIFKGAIRAEGNVLTSEFERLVGAPGRWVTTDELVDRDTLVFTIYRVEDGQRKKLMAMEFKREKDEAGAPAPPAAAAPADHGPLLAKLSTMIGGRWVSDNANAAGTPVAELRWGWSGGRRIAGEGLIAGSPVRAWIGWDPVKKKAYYLDFHGAEQVFFGHAVVEGDEMVFDFKTLIGAPAVWRSRARFPDKDRYEAVIQAQKDGRFEDLHRVNLKRVP